MIIIPAKIGHGAHDAGLKSTRQQVDYSSCSDGTDTFVFPAWVFIVEVVHSARNWSQLWCVSFCIHRQELNFNFFTLQAIELKMVAKFRNHGFLVEDSECAPCLSNYGEFIDI